MVLIIPSLDQSPTNVGALSMMGNRKYGDYCPLLGTLSCHLARYVGRQA